MIEDKFYDYKNWLESEKIKIEGEPERKREGGEKRERKEEQR